MWGLIIDGVNHHQRTTGSQFMTHDKFHQHHHHQQQHQQNHHSFTLPLWNKFAPLTIYNHTNNGKEFPEFKQQLDKKSIIEHNYLNNHNGYGKINGIMGKQKIHQCLDFNGGRPSPPQITITCQIIVGNRKIDEKIDKEKQSESNQQQQQPQQQPEKKKKRRRRRNRNKRKKKQLETEKTIEPKLQHCDSLINLKLLKNQQRQRQISTDSDDSFIVFTDSQCNNINDNDDDDDDDNDLKNSTNFNDYDDCEEKSRTTNKKVRFPDDDEVLCQVHPMVKWSYAYQAARKGPWEQYARDRDRFKKRIKNLEKILLPILNKEHRTRIYQERFN